MFARLAGALLLASHTVKSVRRTVDRRRRDTSVSGYMKKEKVVVVEIHDVD